MQASSGPGRLCRIDIINEVELMSENIESFLKFIKNTTGLFTITSLICVAGFFSIK